MAGLLPQIHHISLKYVAGCGDAKLASENVFALLIVATQRSGAATATATTAAAAAAALAGSGASHLNPSCCDAFVFVADHRVDDVDDVAPVLGLPALAA